MPQRKQSALRKERATKGKRVRRSSPLHPVRSLENPIIGPDIRHGWESKATFNPGAFSADGKVYLLYRAIGDNDMSTLGYASSDDGFRIDERLPHPAYGGGAKSVRAERKEKESLLRYCSGGGWNGGSEDPRLSRIDDTVYLLYTAFDGWASLRIALTSLPLKDFQNKKWRWREPVFISPPGEIHKNWVLFPEKINGKYAILHSVSPRVSIAYFDSLDELDGTKFIRSRHREGGGKKQWDNLMRGAGPPPIKTGEGWLLLYHAMDRRDPDRYKLGAMLLDLKDPRKVLARSAEPILEPDEIYENEGFKHGVVYSCGAVVLDGTLFIYYGGADAVTCVATADLEKFLKELRKTGSPKLKTAKRIAVGERP